MEAGGKVLPASVSDQGFQGPAGLFKINNEVAAKGMLAKVLTVKSLADVPSDGAVNEAQSTGTKPGRSYCSVIGRCFRVTVRVGAANLRLDWSRRGLMGSRIRFAFPVEHVRAVLAEPG